MQSHFKATTQELLYQQKELQNSLAKIEALLEQKETAYFCGHWNENSSVLALSSEPSRRIPELSPNNRVFSTSSVFSRPGLQLATVQFGKQTVTEKVKDKSSKSKKSRKSKKRTRRGRISSKSNSTRRRT